LTALPRRRRRSTILATAAIILTIAAVAGIAIVGGLTLYHSTEGVDASDDRPERTFPDTPTGLIAAVDDDGRLASLAVVVVQPSGAGGSIVTVPVSADASSGDGRERLPVAETAQLSGIDSVRREVEILLGLTIDSFVVADRAQLEVLLGEVGEIEVDLPVDVTDSDGQRVADTGEQTLDPATAAAVLVARDPSMPAAEQYPASTAVWAGFAAAVGDGIDASGVDGFMAAPATTRPPPSTAAGEGIDDVLAQALSGPLGTRGLEASPVADNRNPRDADVVVLDRAEVSFVFGQIAPGKVAAPNPALTFRLESPFDDADLEGSGLTNDELAYRTISRLLFVRGNVLSVDTTPGDVAAKTMIEVADESLVAGVRNARNYLGPIDVRVAEVRIVGVDAVIRLGQSYVDFVGTGGSSD
jgi:LytR_cpsA_psr family